MTFEELLQGNGLQKTWDQYLQHIIGEHQQGHYFAKMVRQNREVLQIEIIASAITYRGEPSIIGTIVDITAQAEEEKRLNKAVTDAQENQRQQISMELHDNVKQMMAASLLNIDFLKMLIKDDETTVPIISNVKNYMREAMEELRRIAHQLAPSVDETISLEEKFRTVVASMNVSGTVTVNYHFEKFEEAIKTDVQLAMYRILQEQFSNILKYANASRVEITVERHNGEIYMAIQDNGEGFDTGLKKHGLGLENIKRRVQVFNGNFRISSAPGKGCRLDVEIPVNGV
jgi:signal transduction histidine kinase